MENHENDRQRHIRQVAEPIREHLKWLFFLRVILLTLLLGLNILLNSSQQTLIVPPLNHIASIIVGVYLYTISSVFFLKKSKNPRRFAFGQILFDTLLVTVLIAFSGGSQSIFLPVYFFPIIAGSIILFRIGGMAAAASCTIGYGGILVLHYLGYYPGFFLISDFRPPQDFLEVLNYFSIYGTSFFVSGFLSSLAAEQLRKTEKALDRTSQKFVQLNILYKQIFDNIATGIITRDERGNISSFNPAAEQITGFRMQEVISRPLRTFFPQLGDQSCLSSRPVTELTRNDTTTIPVAYSCSTLNTPDDSSSGGQVITFQDLSEIRQMEDQVRQAEKMAAIGEMAAVVAHEFRNPLTAIAGSAEILHHSLPESSANRRLLQIIDRECTRLEKSISEFLRFSKPANPKKEWVQLSSVIREVIQILQHSKVWSDRFATEIEIPANMDCWADRQQMVQVMQNLLGNSCQAMGRKGDSITIKAEELVGEDGQGLTRITVSDNGPGIPEELLDKIFNPFFTTREQGTGLGLAIVHQIVSSHHGTISVSSSPDGQGTTFEINLPCPESGREFRETDDHPE